MVLVCIICRVTKFCRIMTIFWGKSIPWPPACFESSLLITNIAYGLTCKSGPQVMLMGILGGIQGPGNRVKMQKNDDFWGKNQMIFGVKSTPEKCQHFFQHFLHFWTFWICFGSGPVPKASRRPDIEFLRRINVLHANLPSHCIFRHYLHNFGIIQNT